MQRYYQQCLALLLLLSCIYGFKPSFRGRFAGTLANSQHKYHAHSWMAMHAGSLPFRPRPTPGFPIVRYVYSNNNLALLSVAVPGSATQKAFADSCERFNEDARVNKRRINGLTVGEKLPYQALYDLYGEAQVKDFCCHFLSEAIADECEQSGLRIIGEGRVTEFNADLLIPGMPHVLELECDLMPNITYNGTNDGYKGLKITVQRSAIDDNKFEEVKNDIRERHAVLLETSGTYEAQLGDTVTVSMRGFDRDAGDEATRLLTSGQRVPLHLDRTKIIPELVDALIGARVGAHQRADVNFPDKLRGPGASMAGKNVTFEMEVRDIKTRLLPDWDNHLAGQIKENLTITELEEQIRAAVAEDAVTGTEMARNEALSRALVDVAQVTRIPEALVEANTKLRYHNKMQDSKEQGATAEQIAAMDTIEQYTAFAKEVRQDAELLVKLTLIFQDIVEKENNKNTSSSENDSGRNSDTSKRNTAGDAVIITTIPVNMTTPEGATITGTVTTTDEPEPISTDNNDRLVVTPVEVQKKLDSMDEHAKVMGNPPIDRKEMASEVASMLMRKKVFNFLAAHADITYLDPAPFVPLSSEVQTIES